MRNRVLEWELRWVCVCGWGVVLKKMKNICDVTSCLTGLRGGFLKKVIKFFPFFGGGVGGRGPVKGEGEWWGGRRWIEEWSESGHTPAMLEKLFWVEREVRQCVPFDFLMKQVFWRMKYSVYEWDTHHFVSSPCYLAERKNKTNRTAFIDAYSITMWEWKCLDTWDEKLI